MLISVIIATYNRPDALVAVLNGLRRQTDREFEILIADDGSDVKTSNAIHSMHGKLGVPIQRIWQPDRGFRAAAIRNRAIAKAQGEYIIFLDGDCVPRPEFIARHRKLAEPGHYVFGQRALLSEQYTDHVLKTQIDLSAKSIPSLIASRLRGRINRLLPFLNVPLGPFRKFPWYGWQRLRGCNFAAWREDLIRIDGFDGAYVGWGGFQKEGQDWDFGLVLKPDRFGLGMRIARRAIDVAVADPRIPAVTFLLPLSRTRLRGLDRLGARFVEEVIYDGVPFRKYHLDTP